MTAVPVPKAHRVQLLPVNSRDLLRTSPSCVAGALLVVVHLLLT